MTPQKIESLLGITLEKLSEFEQVKVKRNSYALDSAGNIIGLNLAGGQFDEQQLSFIHQLGMLELLNLSENKVTKFSFSGSSQALQFINLSENENLTELTFEKGLPNLEDLNLSECQLSLLQLPSGFHVLESLYVQKNALTHLEIKGACPRLKLVDASSNQLTTVMLPDELPELALFFLQGGNKVVNIDFLKNAPNLTTLNLHENGVNDITVLRPLLAKRVPFQWKKTGNGILLEDCPLTVPPPEIIAEGNEAIANYFQQIEAEGIDTLYEAKLLIVGEGEAGKTTLVRRLIDPTLPMPDKTESTKGIDIHHYDFSMSNGKKFRINIWDFGGQEIYHATHQFFLTKRSLYILLDDTRKNHKTIHDEGFKYWLEVIDALSDQSPVLIFQNEKSGRSKQIDLEGMKKRFGNVERKYGGDLMNPDAVNEIKEDIEFFVKKLPHVGESLPSSWIAIRSEIEALAKSTPVITKAAYFEVYKKYNDFEEKQALLLSQYLHDLGVFLHFQDDIWLSNIVILENTWATEAVFKILDDEIVKSQQGFFGVNDCKRIWEASKYASMHPQLLALMVKFELAYRLKDAMPEEWLAPQLLNPSMPIALSDWEQPGDLTIRYQYEFMPKGLVNRLMVRNHRIVPRPELSWKNGVLFEKEQTELLVKIAETGNEIVLRSRGPMRKELLSTIANDLDILNDLFPGLDKSIAKLIPCNCMECKGKKDPEYFPYKQLLRFKNDNRPTIQCRESYENVNVLEVLDGIYLGHELRANPSNSLVSEGELVGMEERLGLLIEKKNYLAKALIFSVDASEKFKLEKELEELEQAIVKYKEELNRFGKGLSKANSTFPNVHESTLDKLLESAENLEKLISTGFKNVDENLQLIQDQLDQQDQQLLNIVQLSTLHQKELGTLFIKLDQLAVNEDQVKELSQEIEALIHHNKEKLPKRSWINGKN